MHVFRTVAWLLSMVWVVAPPPPPSPPLVSLNSINHLTIRGDVDDVSADQFLRASMLAARGSVRYVFISTHGGHVDAGNRIVREVRQKNYTCIADRAYSMGFVILQACGERLITPFASVMQHQISLHLGGDLARVHNYIEMVRAEERVLAQMQASRLRLTVEEFRRRTADEWWMFGEDIVKNGCADRIVDVTCTPALMRKNTTLIQRAAPFVNVVHTYSRCPLVQEPLHSETILHNKCVDVDCAPV